MKTIGKFLILGAILIIVSNYVYIYLNNNHNKQNVDKYIKETSTIVENEEIIQAEKTNNEIKDENNKENNKTINYTAILEIPSINLKQGVVNSTKNFNSINYAISVDKHSNYPDKEGNFILYAHSGNSSIAYFRNLNKVNINDKVYVYYNGIKYEYIITNKYDIKKTGTANIIKSNTDKYITLITCNPNKDGYQIVIIGKIKEEIKY